MHIKILHYKYLINRQYLSRKRLLKYLMLYDFYSEYIVLFVGVKKEYKEWK